MEKAASPANPYTLDFERPLRSLEEELGRLRSSGGESQVDVQPEIDAIVAKIDATKRDIYSNLTAWQRVQLSRHPRRPYALDYIERLFTGFQELHGDRSFRDDRALIGGTAFLDGKPVMIIAQQKGRDTRDKIARNFGMPNPEGYRKALRLMQMAVRFRMPIVALIDTPGAYPGVTSEERHVAEAIAVNLREMARMTVPIVAAVIGEGGSGGALGIGVADRLLILENAYYSVISPEGCAAILWKDRSHAPQAAESLQLNSRKLVELGIADEVIEEPLGGAHRDVDVAAESLGKALREHLKQLRGTGQKQLLENRYQKYRKIGPYEVEAEIEDSEPEAVIEAEAKPESVAS